MSELHDHQPGRSRVAEHLAHLMLVEVLRIHLETASDTALNQGATGDKNSLEGLLARSGNSVDEKTFMTKFYAERTKVVDTHDFNQPPNGTHRVREWSPLMQEGKTNLENVDAAIVRATHWTMHSCVPAQSWQREGDPFFEAASDPEYGAARMHW